MIDKPDKPIDAVNKIPASESVITGARSEVSTSLERPSIEAFTREARAKAEALRNELKQGAGHRFSSTLKIPPGFTGEAWIESEGLLMPIDKGLETDNIYIAEGIRMRMATLDSLQAAREPFFSEIASHFPEHSRVLNIGCGGDLAIEKASAKAGHEVLHTDGSLDVVRWMESRTGGRAFACNLKHLDRILPHKSIDIVMGNAVMGYVAPHRMAEVIGQVSEVMKNGAVFTFDLTPYGSYFQIFDGEREQRTVVNESYVDPAKLTDFIRQYGSEQGPAACWYYYALRSQAVQLGMLAYLKEQFEAQGFLAQTGKVSLPIDAGHLLVWTLRLATEEHRNTLFRPARHEQPFNLTDAYWEMQIRDAERVRIPFFHIDRRQGQEIAGLLGLGSNPKEAPWDVLAFMNGQEHSLSRQTRQELSDRHNPFRAQESIRRAVEAGYCRRPKEMPEANAADQILRAMYLKGEMPEYNNFSEEMAIEIIDRKIDIKYEEVRQKRLRAEQIQREHAKKAEKRAKDKKKRR